MAIASLFILWLVFTSTTYKGVMKQQYYKVTSTTRKTISFNIQVDKEVFEIVTITGVIPRPKIELETPVDSYISEYQKKSIEVEPAFIEFVENKKFDVAPIDFGYIPENERERLSKCFGFVEREFEPEEAKEKKGRKK